MRYFIVFFTVLFMATVGEAKIMEKSISYTHNGTSLEGYLAYDSELSGKNPGVLIVHQWMGLTDYEKHRARQLAELGYVAFALDMYGVDNRPENTKEASALSGKFGKDRQLMRNRAAAGLDQLRQQEGVDTDQIAVMGYCFGGGVALELARSGADLAGTVSFHGTLSSPNTEDAKNINGKVLVLHGAADPHVDQKAVMDFWDEMENADVDWQMNAYGGAVHAFTQQAAGDDPSNGAAYDAQADRRSWESMKRFYEEIFE